MASLCALALAVQAAVTLVDADRKVPDVNNDQEHAGGAVRGVVCALSLISAFASLPHGTPSERTDDCG